ncbi:maleylpyruvate isomerase family mycothiol-dependent enzyme [Jatrophihabitans sp. YIM 134969]
MTGSVDTDAVFAATAAHRLRFADLVESLSDDELATPSLCEGWTTRDVAGHLSVAIVGAPLPYLLGMVRAWGRPNVANRDVAIAAARRPVADLVTFIRRHATSRFVPPGAGPRAPLADVLIHTGDVARPLGRPHEADPDAVGWALDFVTGPRPVGFSSVRRLAGLSFVATDLDRTWGSGAAVRGRGLDLLLAACGRTVALDALTGEGVAVLLSRSEA